MATHIIRRMGDHIAFGRDPLGYHRRQGVRIGKRVELIGGSPHTFGSEPYLVTIGDDVTISGQVTFVTHDGGLRVIRHKHPDAFYYAPIHIGNRVFIGVGALLLPGVSVGDGAVIGARAVVARDVPPDVVVAGVPARPIKAVADYAFARRSDWVDTANLSYRDKEAAILRHFAQAASGGAGNVERASPFVPD